MAKPSFRVSYDLAAEYEIDGRSYNVRTGMHDSNTTGDYRITVRATVGTVMHRDSRQFHEFPPREVVAQFPGMVGARYRADFTVEYDGATPEIAERWPGTWYLVAAIERDAA